MLFSTYNIIHENTFTQLLKAFSEQYSTNAAFIFVYTWKSRTQFQDCGLIFIPTWHPFSLSQKLYYRCYMWDRLKVIGAYKELGCFLVLREERAFTDKRNNRTKKRVWNSRPLSHTNLPRIDRHAEITASWYNSSSLISFLSLNEAQTF
jgi:hypothetical protein